MTSAAELLTNFNLTGQQAEIYLATLGIGKASVQDIAKKTGKSRTATYFHVDHLLKRGLLKETRQGKVTRFVAAPPREIVSQYDHWTTELKSMLPVLESLQKTGAESPIIEVTDSKSGFYKIYDELSSLPVGGTFYCFEGAEGLANELDLLTQEQWHAFFKRIVERKIGTQLLLTQSALDLPQKKLTKGNLDLVRQRNIQVRAVADSAVPFKKLLLFYGNKTAFLFPELSLVISIEHAGVTGIIKLMFDGLYHQGTETKRSWQ